jgi:hypothetical protein
MTAKIDLLYEVEQLRLGEHFSKKRGSARVSYDHEVEFVQRDRMVEERCSDTVEQRRDAHTVDEVVLAAGVGEVREDPV